MTDNYEGGRKEFTAFLKGRPTLDEANSGRLTVISGQVFQSGDGKVAVTQADGQTLELDTAAVEHFKVLDTSELHPVVQLHVLTESLAKATLKPIKPLFKEAVKDPIKDVIQDGTLRGKDIASDPLSDKPVIKDVRTDPLVDQKSIVKDVGTDGAWDPIGTGPGDTFVEGPGGFDPSGPVVNPAAGGAFAAAQTAMPFVMATPHHAAAHLVAQQAGPYQAAQVAGPATMKPFFHDTHKEMVFDTAKEAIRDTFKEPAMDTRKEMTWDTWIEGGPSWQEGTFDPGGIQPPVWNLPGTMF